MLVYAAAPCYVWAPADAARVCLCYAGVCVVLQLWPLCKDPLEDRLLAGCDLKFASRTAAVQIVAVEVQLTALETMGLVHGYPAQLGIPVKS